MIFEISEYPHDFKGRLCVAWYLCHLWQVLLYSTFSFKRRIVGISNEKVTLFRHHMRKQFIQQPTEKFFSPHKTLCRACLEGGVAEGMASSAAIFLGKIILFTSFSMAYSTCAKSLIRKFCKENCGGRKVRQLKNFFRASLT